jgi:hypothetical protein
MHSLVAWTAIGVYNPYCFQGIERSEMAFQLQMN